MNAACEPKPAAAGRGSAWDGGYTKSLLVIFIIPFLFLGRTILRSVRRKPFFAAIAGVSVLGWAWSMLLSYKKWWVFPEKYIVGIRPLPHVPLEEFVIYPIGGAFSIFLYVVMGRIFSLKSGGIFRTMLTGTTAAFLALALARLKKRPYYLFSQLVLYNGLSLLLSPVTARHIRAGGLVGSVAILGTIGFIWDYLAFKFGWWVYNATTGVKLFRIPIEDVNFYLMAPTAAISLYVALCRLFKSDAATERREPCPTA
jgi:lycopene cyclase domain-containing protein